MKKPLKALAVLACAGMLTAAHAQEYNTSRNKHSAIQAYGKKLGIGNSLLYGADGAVITFTWSANIENALEYSGSYLTFLTNHSFASENPEAIELLVNEFNRIYNGTRSKNFKKLGRPAKRDFYDRALQLTKDCIEQMESFEAYQDQRLVLAEKTAEVAKIRLDQNRKKQINAAKNKRSLQQQKIELLKAKINENQSIADFRAQLYKEINAGKKNVAEALAAVNKAQIKVNVRTSKNSKNESLISTLEQIKGGIKDQVKNELIAEYGLDQYAESEVSEIVDELYSELAQTKIDVVNDKLGAVNKKIRRGEKELAAYKRQLAKRKAALTQEKNEWVQLSKDLTASKRRRYADNKVILAENKQAASEITNQVLSKYDAQVRELKAQEVQLKIELDQAKMRKVLIQDQIDKFDAAY